MLNEKYILVTNIFFLPDKNILIIKGLDEKHTLEMLDYPMFLNDIFIKNISLINECFIEKKMTHTDERAFECKQNLNELKGVDLTLNILRLKIK